MSERVRLTKTDDALVASKHPLVPFDADDAASYGYDWVHGGIGWRPRRSAPVTWLRLPVRFFWLLAHPASAYYFDGEDV